MNERLVGHVVNYMDIMNFNASLQMSKRLDYNSKSPSDGATCLRCFF